MTSINIKKENVKKKQRKINKMLKIEVKWPIVKKKEMKKEKKKQDEWRVIIKIHMALAIL